MESARLSNSARCRRYRKRLHEPDSDEEREDLKRPLTKTERNRRYREKRKVEKLPKSKTPLANKQRVQIYRDCIKKRQVNNSNIFQKEHIVTASNVSEDEHERRVDICKNFWIVRRNCIKLDSRRVDVLEHFRNYMTKHFFSDTLDDYCRICDRLWWTSRLIRLQRNTSLFTFVQSLNYYDMQEPFMVCSNCRTFLRREKIPTLAKMNGFVYPEIPSDLPELCPISERLVSPRLPFMQIRHIRYFAGSRRLLGQIANVPVDVNNMVMVLPRRLDDDYTFNVCLKRKLLHTSSYMAGCISKRDIKLWLKELVKTPLYRKYNIVIDDCFFVADDEENSVAFARQLANGYDKVAVRIRHTLEEIPRRNEHYMTSEEVLTKMQETLFWSEDMVRDMAPGQNVQPFAISFDADAEELSFPMIYFGHPREFTVRAIAYSIASSEIRRRDRRGVKSNHILYMAAKIMRLRMIDSLNVMFRANNDTVHSITRSEIENRQFVKETMERNESFLRHIPNSVQYWYGRKRDLFAMMRQLGKPTLFLTLSASETYWIPLLRYIYKFQNRIPAEQNISDEIFEAMTATVRAELLVNSDPVICCLYFDKLVDTILNALKRTTGPFGKYHVVDYFRRIEFQHRGSPHCHMLLWLANAPVDVEQRLQDGRAVPHVITIIDSLCTVDQSLLMGGRQLQTHRHTHTCYKKILNDVDLELHSGR